jgi:hypothetical protein
MKKGQREIERVEDMEGEDYDSCNAAQAIKGRKMASF